MDKKIKTEIAVGIILIIALIFGGLIWLNGHKKIVTTNNAGKTNKISQENQKIQKLNIPSDWKQYKNNVLGIEFYYPEKWGEPKTDPAQHITNLSHVVDQYTGDNLYNNNLAIVFSNEDSPMIHIFNENYKAQNEPFNYTMTGIAGDITNLKKTGDICDYKISFNYRNGNSFKEVYSKCDAGVKEVMMQEMQDFRRSSMPGVGIVYSYDLSQLAFKKLQNGYFDNAIIRYNVGYTGQIKESNPINVGEFLSMVKKSSGDYEQMKNDFATFVSNIKTYKPIIQEKSVFQSIPGEDPNITTIRKYYFAISNGKLEEAYGFYKENSVSFDEFKGWYQNTYYANPTQFEKIGTNQYRFFVDFQDNNQYPQRYRVAMEVSTGKIKTLSSEKIFGEKVSFKNKSVFAKQRKGKNYLILSENNQEKIIDEANASDEEDPAGGLFFSEPKFSPNGNFISYGVIGWEWYATRIYDIQKKKMTLELSYDNNNDFTPDEKYLYACTISAFSGEQHGNVYKLPDFKVQYDLFSDSNSENFMDVECNYDNTKKVIRFTLSDKYGDEQYNPDQKRVIEYSLVDKKEHIIQQ